MGFKGKASSIDVEIGINVRTLRIARGITQEVLADGIGVTFQQIQKYEKGSNRISLTTALEICDFMKIPLSTLCPKKYQTQEATAILKEGVEQRGVKARLACVNFILKASPSVFEEIYERLEKIRS